MRNNVIIYILLVLFCTSNNLSAQKNSLQLEIGINNALGNISSYGYYATSGSSFGTRYSRDILNWLGVYGKFNITSIKRDNIEDLRLLNEGSTFSEFSNMEGGGYSTSNVSLGIKFNIKIVEDKIEIQPSVGYALSSILSIKDLSFVETNQDLVIAHNQTYEVSRGNGLEFGILGLYYLNSKFSVGASFDVISTNIDMLKTTSTEVITSGGTMQMLENNSNSKLNFGQLQINLVLRYSF